MKRGMIITRRAIPHKAPRRERRIASCPFPFNKRKWPGRTERAVSSSGAPR